MVGSPGFCLWVTTSYRLLASCVYVLFYFLCRTRQESQAAGTKHQSPFSHTWQLLAFQNGSVLPVLTTTGHRLRNVSSAAAQNPMKSSLNCLHHAQEQNMSVCQLSPAERHTRHTLSAQTTTTLNLPTWTQVIESAQVSRQRSGYVPLVSMVTGPMPTSVQCVKPPRARYRGVYLKQTPSWIMLAMSGPWGAQLTSLAMKTSLLIVGTPLQR